MRWAWTEAKEEEIENRDAQISQRASGVTRSVGPIWGLSRKLPEAAVVSCNSRSAAFPAAAIGPSRTAQGVVDVAEHRAGRLVV